MFKIDYNFQRGGPEYHHTLPAEEDRNNSIFVALGRNDQGKSTLLQMIALGLYADKSEDIDKSLRDKMLRLIAEDTQECDIDFTIGTKEVPNLLRATVHDRKVDTTFRGNRVGADAVNERFKILFDVPDDPIRKLQNAIGLVEHTFGYYIKCLNDYSGEITKIKSDYDTYQKRQNRLITLASKKEGISAGLELIDARKKELEQDLAVLRESYVATSYHRLYTDLNKLDNRRKVYEKRLKELRDRGVGAPSQTYKKQSGDFEARLSAFKSSVTYLARFSDAVIDMRSRELDKLATEIESAYSPKQVTDSQIKKWHEFFASLRETLSKNPLYETEPAERYQIELFGRLLTVLKQFVSLEVAIPATDGKTVGEFIKALESAKKSVEGNAADVLTVSEALEACQKVITCLSELGIARSILPDKDYKDEDDFGQLTKQVNSLKAEEHRIDNERRKLEDEYMAIPEDGIRKYVSSGRNVEQEYEDAQKELKRLEAEKENLAVSFAKLEGHENELKAIQPPPKINISECEAVSEVIERIQWKIPHWEKALQAIDITNLDKQISIDDASHEFYDALGSYFADILGVVYFEDKSWHINKLDFAKRAYVVEGRSPISFNDIGTGHTALNSLLTRLKQDFAGRQKIVLFDEIGVMDEQNVARLLDEIKQRVRSGDVLLALLTQVDNSLDGMVLKPIAYDP